MFSRRRVSCARRHHHHCRRQASRQDQQKRSKQAQVQMQPPSPHQLLGHSCRHGQDGIVFIIVVLEAKALCHVPLLLQLIPRLLVL